MWLVYVLMIILVILIFISFIYSSALYVASSNVTTSFKKVDDILRKRFNLACKLIDLSIDYFKKSKDVYEDMINLRKINYNNLNNYGKFKLSGIVNAIILDIKMVGDTKKELSEDNKYKLLINNDKKLNDELMNCRKSYNDNVNKYNRLISNFVGKIIASMFGFKLKEYYGILDGERNNIKLNL